MVNKVVAKNETEFEKYKIQQGELLSVDLIKIQYALKNKDQYDQEELLAINALHELKMTYEMKAIFNSCKDRYPEKKEQLDTLLKSYISKDPLPPQHRKDGIKRSSLLEVERDSVIPSYDQCVRMIEKLKKENVRVRDWANKKEYARNIDMLMLIKDITQNSNNSEDIALVRFFEEPVGITTKKRQQRLDYNKQLKRDKNIVDGEKVESRVDGAAAMMRSMCLVDSKVSNKVVDGIKDELDKADGEELTKQEIQTIASSIRGLLDDSEAKSSNSFKKSSDVGGD